MSNFLGSSWKNIGGYERTPIGNYTRVPYIVAENLISEEAGVNTVSVYNTDISNNTMYPVFVSGTGTQRPLLANTMGESPISFNTRNGDINVVNTLKIGQTTVAIGKQTGNGNISQQSYAIAIGANAGNNNQQGNAIAIGANAGQTNQQGNAIAIGANAGNNSQQSYAIAIGNSAGNGGQQSNAIAIGNSAGNSGQQSNAIAIGANAGYISQGKNAIAIGNQAGQTQQPQNSIVLNASGSALSGTKENALYVTPIREDTASGAVALGYNPLTKEVTYFNNSNVLWASGSLITSTDTAFPFMDWSSFAGNIDLNLFNIRYEIECNWNYSASVYPSAYIHIAPNNITASDYSSDPNTSSLFVGGVTNWTNIISGGPWGNITQEFNQSYRNRFFGGFAPQTSGSLTEYRSRTILNGELMLQTRPTGQSGITDLSTEERNIFNRFTCTNYTTQRVGGNWLTYSYNGSDFNNSHMQIYGTAIFGAQIYWNTFLASGINRIGLRLNDGFTPTDTRPRGAQYIYRIYRVRK